MAPRVKLKAGELFLMPLPDDLAAVGVVARLGRSPMILCYLFKGDRSWSSTADIPDGVLDPHNALLIRITDSRKIRSGDWPILGQVPGWTPEDWSLPRFADYDMLLHNQVVIVEYEDDLLTSKNFPGAPGDAEGLFPGAVSPAAGVEKRMHEILTSPQQKFVRRGALEVADWQSYRPGRVVQPRPAPGEGSDLPDNPSRLTEDEQEEKKGAEHALLLHIRSLTDPGTGLEAIEDPIEQAIDAAGIGEFDGNGIDLETGEAVLYMYGPDTDALWSTIEAIARNGLLGPGAYAIKRYGAPGAREVRIDL